MSMMYVARNEMDEGEINQKYHDLFDNITSNHDYSVTDMMDNLEYVYQLINKNHSIKRT
ncbi:DNA-directed RNA polymerase delta subunit [Cytobacillus purgationiresistens]|uniref:DNA-directed RNA polymerase delta subunit n=2 Tax=Cytobacillus purgationiresistens TaxID=863449 RepID=A0ABU0AQN9_9BACI|nr:DNA-directed RNA polymerase delta subunit [Cytobacillus purgationiresistens]